MKTFTVFKGRDITLYIPTFKHLKEHSSSGNRVEKHGCLPKWKPWQEESKSKK